MIKRAVCAMILAVTGCSRGGGGVDWRTRAERTDYVETSRYDETDAYCRQLAAHSPWIRYSSFGQSGEGRPLPLLIVSREGAFTPQQAALTGKPVVFIFNGIHAGEIDGKEASLALVRDIAIKRIHAALLDHVILLVNPIYNVDGHERFGPYNRINQNGPREMGWRVTSRNLNLNRDFTKVDAVETRAWLRLYNEWNPQLFIDNHTNDGSDYQYDIMFAATEGPGVAESISEWVSTRLDPWLLESLKRDGHTSQLLFNLRDRRDPARGLDAGGGLMPRFSTGYGAISNRVAILTETHVWPTFRQRIVATYDLMVHTLELINRDPIALMDAVRRADDETVRLARTQAGHAKIVLTTTRPADDAGIPVTFFGYEHRLQKSEASGKDYIVWDRTKPITVPTKMYLRSLPDRTTVLPSAYYIPVQWTNVIERLEWHGIKMTRLTGPLSRRVHSVRFNKVRWNPRPFEGRLELTFESTPIEGTRTFRAGSVVVPLDQPKSRVAVNLLAPEGPDSLVHWGFFNAIFEQKEYFEDYVMAPIADRMLRDNSALREEFTRRMASDSVFAADADARLRFFYERSPWRDGRKDVYPIAWDLEPTGEHAAR